MAKDKITVQGIPISVQMINGHEYISLTDIAKKSTKEARFLIMSWMKNASTLEFLLTWESLYNKNFKRDHLVTFKNKYQQNRNVLTPQLWINEMGAVGIISSRGRYGGTFAHPDIALNFCYWLSPSFQVYMFREFQRLKKLELKSWSVNKVIDNLSESIHLLEEYHKPKKK